MRASAGAGGAGGAPPGAAEVPLSGSEAAYEVLGELGRGAGGEVQKVRQRATGRVLALKRVAARREGMGPALEEARVLSRLQHPNVIRYYDSFVDRRGRLCLVTSFCPGGDLAGEVTKAREGGSPIPEARVLMWLAQLAAALEYLHAKHVLHRDLKPQNVFIGRGGVLRVGDFGVAKAMDATDDLAQTCTGTPFYLAPEVCRNKGYGFKSDCWSLGCIAYELLALEPAFAADSLMSVVYKIAKGKVKALPEGRCSPELEDLVHRLLARQPEQRPGPREVRKAPWLQARLAELEREQLRAFGAGGEGDGAVSLVAGTGAVEAAMAQVRETEREVARRSGGREERERSSQLKRHQNLGRLQVGGAAPDPATAAMAGPGAGLGPGAGAGGPRATPGGGPPRRSQGPSPASGSPGWFPPTDLQSPQARRQAAAASTAGGTSRSAAPGPRPSPGKEKRTSRAVTPGERRSVTVSPSQRLNHGTSMRRASRGGGAVRLEAEEKRERVLAWTPGAELAQAHPPARSASSQKRGWGLCGCLRGTNPGAVGTALKGKAGGGASKSRAEAAPRARKAPAGASMVVAAAAAPGRLPPKGLEKQKSRKGPRKNSGAAPAGGGRGPKKSPRPSPRPGAGGGGSRRR